VWWIANRTFQHMKDEGLAIEVQFLKQLPIPTVPLPLRSDISQTCGALMDAVASAAQMQMISALELDLNSLVEQAYSLTKSERELMLSSLPPRDPVETFELKSLPRTGPSRAKRQSPRKSSSRANEESGTGHPVVHASDRLERR
jgi:hypothetical protein